MHAAEAPAERTTFVDFEVGSFPNAKILGNGVAIVAGDLKGIGVLRAESALSDLRQEKAGRRPARCRTRLPVCRSLLRRPTFFATPILIGEHLFSSPPMKQTSIGLAPAASVSICDQSFP